MKNEIKDFSYEYHDPTDEHEFIAMGIPFEKVTFDDGAVYIGECQDDEFHGQGTFISSNGSKFIGEWRDGEFHGQGTFISSNGSKFIGEWRDGKQHGEGTLIHFNGDRYSGEFWDGEIVGQGTGVRSISVKRVTEIGDFVPTIEKYVGKFMNGLPHGKGTYYYENGDKFIGEWRDGEVYGSGTFISNESDA